jgi:hypothetical protein
MKSYLLLVSVIIGIFASPALTRASDHDDGENDVKARSLNLTDLYVFREGDQTGNAADNANLILVMNTNPRSLARQQYYFSTQARYEFHVTRRSGPNETVTGGDDVILRFTFGEPNDSAQQPITVNAIVDGSSSSASTNSGGGSILTTAINGTPVLNEVNVGGETLTVFSGLREDPFFFDVESFFRVRAGALGIGPAVGFLSPAEASDFARGYNVNAIVVRVPIAFLAGSSGATTFDVWETISIPDTIMVP